MPRYFFHTADGSRNRDTEGTELLNHDVARVQAIKYAGALLTDEPDVLRGSRDFRIEVTDNTDILLFTVIMLAFDAPVFRTERASASGTV